MTRGRLSGVQAIVFDLGTVRYGASRGVEWTLGR